MPVKEQKSTVVRLPPPPRSPLRSVQSTRPVLSLKAICLTPSTQSTLHGLITQAAARTGRKISASAVVRALLRWAREKEHTSEIVAFIVVPFPITSAFSVSD